MKCKLGGYLFVRLKCFVYHGRLQFFFLWFARVTPVPHAFFVY